MKADIRSSPAGNQKFSNAGNRNTVFQYLTGCNRNITASIGVFVRRDGRDRRAKEKKKKKTKLSQRRFNTLEPFTVPMMDNGEISEQFTIVIGVELADKDDRFDIVHSVPRIRNEVYNELLHLVTFRRRGAAIPQLTVLRLQLLMVTQRLVGDKIKVLVIQQAFKWPSN